MTHLDTLQQLAEKARYLREQRNKLSGDAYVALIDVFLAEVEQTGGLTNAEENTNIKNSYNDCQKLQIAVEQSANTIVITDMYGQIEYINPKFTETSGYSFEEVKKQNINMLKSGVQSKEVYKDLWQTITTGRVWRGEFNNVRKNGELYWESASIAPIKTPAGDIRGYIGIKEDITLQKKYQQEVVEMRLFSEAIVSCMGEGIIVLNNDFEFTLINTAAEIFLGMSTSTLIGQSALGKFESDLQLNIAQSLQSVLLGETLETDDLQYINPRTGRSGWCYYKYSPLVGANANIIGVVIVVSDISDRKRSEIALADSEWRLKRAQKMAKIGNWYFDHDHQNMILSSEFTELFSIDTAHFSSSYQSFLNLVHPDDKEWVTEALDEGMQKKMSDDLNHRLLLPSGEVRYVVGRCETIYDGRQNKKLSIGTMQDITVLKNTELQLAASMEKWKSLIVNSPDFILITNIDGRINFINKSHSTEVDTEHLVGKSVFEFVAPGYENLVRRKILKTLIDRKTVSFESEIVTLNEKKLTLYNRVVPTWENNKMNQFMIIATDITERKAIENQLRRSEQFYNSTINSIGDQIHVVDRQLNFELANQATLNFNRRMGITVDVNGRNLFDIYPHLDQPTTSEQYKAVFETGTPRTDETILQLDGETIYQETHRHPVFAGREVIKVITTVIDTTKRKQSEAAHHKSERRFRQLIENIEDIFWVYDYNENRFEYVSPQFEAVFQLPVTTLNNNLRALLQRIFAEDLSLFFKGIRDLRHNGRADTEFRIVLKNKSLRWVQIRSYQVVDEYEQRSYWVGIAKDISGRKNTQRQIMKAIIETEDRERNRIAKDLHDDLGAQLSGVNLYLNMMAENRFDDNEKQHYLQDTIELVGEAINNTRRIANNMRPHMLSNFGLLEAIRDFCNRINRAGGVHIEFTSGNLTINIDDDVEVILYRVITEMINNSLKHSGATSIEIDIYLENDMLRVAYEDNGTGFDYQKKINVDEIGMGLKNIEHRIKSINGKLHISTAPEKGYSAMIDIYTT